MCLGIQRSLATGLSYVFVVGSWAVAAALLGITIYLAVDSPTYNYAAIWPNSDFNTAVWETAIYLTLCLSVCLAGMAVLGFNGVRKVHGTYLLMFALVCIVCVAGFVIALILAAVWKGQVNDRLVDVMVGQLYKEYVNETSPLAVSRDWNKMQQELKCCGAYYFPDYKLYSNYSVATDELVPYTCCNGGEANEMQCRIEAVGRNGSATVTTPEILFVDGCYWSMLALVEKHTSMLISAVCIAAVVEGLAVFFTCALRDIGLKG